MLRRESVNPRSRHHPERREWLLYAFDPAERPVAGVRKREWQAVASTVAEMARCLREIAAGSVPN